MGGLAALFLDRGAAVDPRRFQRICAAVPFRASEGIHIWHGDGAAMARLVSVAADEPAAPIVADADLVLVFDGRLDNRDALAATLAVRETASDAQLALAAVRRWDVEAPAHLLGDFAFIAWDARSRRLLLARDHMGIRPLHYVVRPGAVVCGSDLTHVLAEGSVPRRPNPRVAAEFLACEIRNGEETLYDGIARVPPAHVVTIERGSARPHRYWSAVPSRRLALRSDDEYAERCRELLIASVEARMRSAVPVCATLSGGIDSSSVALVAHRLVRGQPAPPLFSMVFPDHPEADERSYIDAVAERCGAVPTFIAPSPPVRSLAARASAWMNAPSMAADEMAERMWAVMRARGHRAALTGAGGDFVYAGSIFHHADLLRQGRLLTLLRRYRDDRRAEATGASGVAWLQAAIWPALPVPVKRGLRPLARWAAPRVGIRRRPGWLRLPVPEAEYPEQPRGGSFAIEELVRSLTGGMHSFVLEGSERAAAEAGVELRHPLLDVRLTEFGLAIPEEQRRRGPILKFVLRHALRDELPAVLATRRTKGDFAHCVWDAMQRLGGERFYSALQIADAGWVDGGAVRELYRRMRADVPRGPAHYGLHIPELWMITTIELWFRAAFGAGRLPEAIMSLSAGGDMDERKPDQDAQDGEKKDAKRPYSTPELIEYGSVTQLTAGSLSKQSDAPAAGFKKTN